MRPGTTSQLERCRPFGELRRVFDFRVHLEFGTVRRSSGVRNDRRVCVLPGGEENRTVKLAKGSRLDKLDSETRIVEESSH